MEFEQKSPSFESDELIYWVSLKKGEYDGNQ
jgi:hypothetical protein